MSEMHNIAAWLPAVGAKLELRPAPIPEPGQDELLIQVGDVKRYVNPRHTAKKITSLD
jgi:hypothetical protein